IQLFSFPKELEAICVQLQPGQVKEDERPAPSLASIQSNAVTLSQLDSRDSNISGLSIINPQIIRIQPRTGTEQHQFLQNSDSPVQLLLQGHLPPHGSESGNKIPTCKTLNGQKTTCATTGSANVSLVAASSANAPISSLEKKEKKELKLKKSLKVKTRSGRISRPPKYKAKDYKFIKTEDLADGHQSDSDDYSELSVEEDEEGKAEGMDALFSVSNYNLKPKKFKCQTCEKSYIGKGGLARHYKLNPGHGQLESSQQKLPLNKTNGSVFVFVENAGGTEDGSASLMLSEPTTVTLNNENALASGFEETASSEGEQQTGKSSEDKHLLATQQTESGLVRRGPGMPKGPGRPRRPKRRGRPRMAGRSRCSGRLSRSGRSPSKSLNNVATDHVFRRKARLKEIIQQCDNEDLIELALPRLAEFVTVYEFLLMKVENGCPARAFFPDVYKEFEELHNMIKKMAQDHLCSSDFLRSQQPIEIKYPKVAESLGITEKILEKQTQAADSSQQCTIKTMVEQVPAEILGQKRVIENSGGELLPSAKKTKVEDPSGNMDDVYANQNGVKQKSGNLNIITIKDGFNPLNGVTVHSEDRGIAHCTVGLALHESFADLETSFVSASSHVLPQSMETKMEYPQPVSTQGPNSTGNVSPPHTEALLPVVTDHSPEEFVEAQFINESAAGRLTNSEFCSSMLSDIVMDSHCSNLSASEHSDHNGKFQKIQQEEEIQNYGMTNKHSQQLNDTNIAEQIQHLEKVFSTSIVPIDDPCRTQTEPHDSPVQESSIATGVNHGSPLKNIDEFSCETEEQHTGPCELENVVTVSETVAFEITDESHEFLSQGHEQIFIQTSDGLILSHPGTAVLSQTEGIVIVTDADGTTMHIRTPDGVPFETVEALLAMEADGQSEDILLSHSEEEP
ncbi:PREDICTED: zinc finger protein 839, partial [Crocodylus porosus]|uniref:zinc finger protein 839 n=1 Tax=Crocodylus porosus TaxID=8502 RepID=UPI00094006A3